MTENNKTENSAGTVSQKPVIERTFELAVYDITVGDSGKEEYRKVSFPEPVTVTACSQAELQSKLAIFQQCGQIAKVTRVIAEKTISGGTTTLQTNTTSAIVDNSQHDVKHASTPVQPPNVKSTIQPSITTSQIAIDTLKTKPRFFKVGDIEVKDDNGKIYQKQWMRLSESEAQNIRVVNDKNNATINLIGKHLEMKKWVLIENSDDTDESTALEENLK